VRSDPFALPKIGAGNEPFGHCFLSPTDETFVGSTLVAWKGRRTCGRYTTAPSLFA
jgi:hypothetical protein